MHDPTLAGMTPEMAAAVAVSHMRLCQAKSFAVVAAPTTAQPKTGENAGEGSEIGKEMEAEEDPLTSDDEENELQSANAKEGEAPEKVKITKTAKAAKKAKPGKSAGASSAATQVVKTTIGKQSP